MFGLIEQLSDFFLLGLEPGQCDLFAANRACILLMDPLRDANFVEKVCLAG